MFMRVNIFHKKKKYAAWRSIHFFSHAVDRKQIYFLGWPNDLAQYGRRTMVDIRGIPRWHNEDTDAIVSNLGNLD